MYIPFHHRPSSVTNSTDLLATMCCEKEHEFLRKCFIEFSSFRNRLVPPFAGPVSLTLYVCNTYGFRTMFFGYRSHYGVSLFTRWTTVMCVYHHGLEHRSEYHNVLPPNNLCSTRQFPFSQQGGLLRMPSLNRRWKLTCLYNVCFEA
jgi:hypothetical protein